MSSMQSGTFFRRCILISQPLLIRAFRSKKLSRAPVFTPGLIHSPYGVASRYMSEFYSPLPTQKLAHTNAVFQIVTHGAVAELKELLQMEGCDANIRNEDLKTPLMIAAENGRCEMLSVLIENGAKVNLQDIFGDTALMLAAREQRKNAVKLLLEAGAQPDIVNNEEMTAADTTLCADIDTDIRKTQDRETEPSFQI